MEVVGMPPGMRSDTDLMAAAAADASGVSESLTTALTTLMNNLAPMATAWQGGGGNAFQTVRAAIEEEMTNLNNALNFLADEVGASGTDYTGTDSDMTTEVNRAGADVTGITAALQRG
jgi:WXG100 family type VII secretion target